MPKKQKSQQSTTAVSPLLHFEYLIKQKLIAQDEIKLVFCNQFAIVQKLHAKSFAQQQLYMQQYPSKEKNDQIFLLQQVEQRKQDKERLMDLVKKLETECDTVVYYIDYYTKNNCLSEVLREKLNKELTAAQHQVATVVQRYVKQHLCGKHANVIEFVYNTSELCKMEKSIAEHGTLEWHAKYANLLHQTAQRLHTTLIVLCKQHHYVPAGFARTSLKYHDLVILCKSCPTKKRDATKN